MCLCQVELTCVCLCQMELTCVFVQVELTCVFVSGGVDVCVCVRWS